MKKNLQLTLLELLDSYNKINNQHLRNEININQFSNQVDVLVKNYDKKICEMVRKGEI